MTSATSPAGARPPRAADAPLAPPGATGGLIEVLRRRYLLRLLVRSAIDARYQGTLLGWVWSYLQPFVRFCMFYFLFEIFIGRGGSMENYAIHIFAAMVLVHFFTETFSGGTKSLVSNRALIVKLPMPRELFPVASMLVALWHTGPMLVILTVASLALGWTPDLVGVGAGLLGFALIAVLGLALALFFSVANVFFRDFGKVVQTLTQFTTFSVPMIYPFTLVEDRFGSAAQYYLLNPVAEAVLLIQRCFWIGTNSDPAAAAREHLPADLYVRGGVMLGVCLVLLVLAQLWFLRYEKRVPERL